MCKVFIAPHVKTNEVDRLWKLASALVPHLSEYDQDGIGYASMTREGRLFGERWLNPKHSFKYTGGMPDATHNMLRELEGCLVPVDYSRFGTINKRGAINLLLHARMATCGKTLENVHPFVRDNFALIHNGVVRGSKDTYNVTSTCDSELILNNYLDLDLDLNMTRLDSLFSNFSGYQAIGLLGIDKMGRMYTDIWRDNTASLYCIKINKLTHPVFCTKAEIVRAACKDLGWKVVAVAEVKAFTAMRFDSSTGKLIEKHDIQPKPSQVMIYGNNVGEGISDSRENWRYDEYWDKKDAETHNSVHKMNDFKTKGDKH